jgi:hypothetical protein
MKSAEERARDVCKWLCLPESGAAYIAINHALKEQDKITRHACAKALLQCRKLNRQSTNYDPSTVYLDEAYASVMNAEAV